MILKQADLRFLVDVNLPKRFQFFNSDEFIHVTDINPSMSDKKIWDYSLVNNMVILTKDTDFYNFFLVNNECPKVVYFKTGNMTLKEMHKYFNEFWSKIISRLATSSFIIAFRDKIITIQ
jgi:predicted nuclease of predicted toxin-antitoxin system